MRFGQHHPGGGRAAGRAGGLLVAARRSSSPASGVRWRSRSGPTSTAAGSRWRWPSDQLFVSRRAFGGRGPAPGRRPTPPAPTTIRDRRWLTAGDDRRASDEESLRRWCRPTPHRPRQLGVARRVASRRAGGGVRPRRRAVRRGRAPALPRAALPRLGGVLRGLRRRPAHRRGGPAARGDRPRPPDRAADRPAHPGAAPDAGLAGALPAALGPADHARLRRLRRVTGVQAAHRRTSCGPTASTCAWPSRTTGATTTCSTPRASPACTSTPATTSSRWPSPAAGAAAAGKPSAAGPRRQSSLAWRSGASVSRGSC